MLNESPGPDPAPHTDAPADTATSRPVNRLIGEKSPYLLQHAHNPVDWYPWGDEAFERARREDKPVFLSIGYSTCHWCHVMERESFEDPQVAALMNRVFINIKVDREERPDVDAVYMTVCQMMTGGGGWPLTILMTPDRHPFFAATYIPKHSRFGQPGMLELIPLIESAWHERRLEIVRAAAQITDTLRRAEHMQRGGAFDASTLEAAWRMLDRQFDSQHGGFGSAPKFPTPHNLTFLLRYWKRTGEGRALQMVTQTLDAMRRGGIFDQVGFGFHRYSTDSRWLLPHFEKMLYDQAGLAVACTEAWQATGRDDYRRTAEEIFTYVLRDMTSPEGAFYSAEDADSQGQEGRFYLWTAAEIRAALAPQDAQLFIEAFGVRESGNFTHETGGEADGANILHLPEPLDVLAARHNIAPQALRERLDAGLRALLAVRDGRVRPLRDDKILTDWNGLMIAALARAARAFERNDYTDAARRAAGFIETHLQTADGRLLHRWREGEAAIPAFLDDYAMLIAGLIELHQTTFETRWLEWADRLTRSSIELFWDADGGGFFLTPADGEPLIVRKKEIYDGATPSGNSLMFGNLLRLGRLLARPDYEDRANDLAAAFSEQIARLPMAHTQFLTELDSALGPAHEVVIAAPPGAGDARAMLCEINRRFLPGTVLLVRPDGPDDGETARDNAHQSDAQAIFRLAPWLQECRALDGRATAYVCRNRECHAPTTNISRMLELLGQTGAPGGNSPADGRPAPHQ
ncbi:MAG: thioredoxin domain-containing protein [Candidatus Sumerlaeia bacterium]